MINCFNLCGQITPSMFGLTVLEDSVFEIKGKYSYDFENNRIFYVKKNTSNNKSSLEWFYEDYIGYKISKLNNDSNLIDIYSQMNLKNGKFNGEFINYCIVNGQKIFLSKGILTNNKRDGFWIKYDMYGNLFYTGIYQNGKLNIGYLYNFKEGYLYICTGNKKLKRSKGPIKIQITETNYDLMLDKNHGENIFIRY